MTLTLAGVRANEGRGCR